MSARFVSIIMFVSLVLAAIAITAIQFGYGIVYVTTPSVPTGLYLKVGTRINYRVGQMVLFQPLPSVRSFMVRRGWLQSDGELVKYVFAVSGDHVCVKGHQLLINNRGVAEILQHDSSARLLPHWRFCGVVPMGQLLLMSTDQKNSFDSRYFGFVPRTSIDSLVRKIKWSS